MNVLRAGQGTTASPVRLWMVRVQFMANSFPKANIAPGRPFPLNGPLCRFYDCFWEGKAMVKTMGPRPTQPIPWTYPYTSLYKVVSIATANLWTAFGGGTTCQVRSRVYSCTTLKAVNLYPPNMGALLASRHQSKPKRSPHRHFVSCSCVCVCENRAPLSHPLPHQKKKWTWFPHVR